MTYNIIKIIIIIMLLIMNIDIQAFNVQQYNNTENNIIIWCIDKNHKTSKPITNSKGYTFCIYKNIILPKQSHLEVFNRIYWNDTIKIANRMALINFESAFNEFAVSPGWDYWYIQIRHWKWALW